MQIKRFEASTMKEAFRKIKIEFGKDAVILSARNIKSESGVLGAFAKKGVEVTAALDSKANGEMADAAGRHAAAAFAYRSAGERYTSPARKMPSPEAVAMPKQKRRKSFVGRMKRVLARNAVAARESAPLMAFHQDLVQAGIEDEIALEIIEEIVRIKGAHEMFAQGQRQAGMVEVMKAMGMKGNPVCATPGKRTVVALVGGSGTGKTTTLMKLAYESSVCRKQSVGIISLDVDRIGAMETLSSLARIMNLPLHPASDKKSMKDALKKLKKTDLILMDTAGMEPADDHALEKMTSLLRVAKPDETLLVSDLTMREDVQQAMYDHLRGLPLSGLVFTGMDVAQQRGTILNQLFKTRLACVYIADGRDIAGNLQPVTDLNTVVASVLHQKYDGVEHETPAARKLTLVHDHASDRPDGSNYFVANRNSDIFHSPDCRSVQRIKARNLTDFDSVEEALEKGFMPCRSCCSHYLDQVVPAFTDNRRVSNARWR